MRHTSLHVEDIVASPCREESARRPAKDDTAHIHADGTSSERKADIVISIGATDDMLAVAAEFGRTRV
jgi:hypothetical protein